MASGSYGLHYLAASCAHFLIAATSAALKLSDSRNFWCASGACASNTACQRIMSSSENPALLINATQPSLLLTLPGNSEVAWASRRASDLLVAQGVDLAVDVEQPVFEQFHRDVRLACQQRLDGRDGKPGLAVGADGTQTLDLLRPIQAIAIGIAPGWGEQTERFVVQQCRAR